ncbi:hypothetical protein [Congregibacter litoralis]|uniref:DUF4760 domain-containing protein n=1 Tax=Congregibacter litoralis KT71 TaxID=314285 RepID=A4AC86_9GAMM|nr:hypothetical protein [Congregibacter litoralis]EAQ96314.1 hypothetical protein KT71_13045 [Congregibacter litoralis KT71]
MTLEEWSYVSQIVGVVLVVITLVYLAVQVRQGTQLLLSEARQVALTTDQGGVYKFIDFPGLGRSMSGTEVPSFEEKTQLMFWIIAQMRAREHEWLQYEAGALDGDAWLSYRDVIYFILGTPRARELWALCSGYFHEGFVSMVAEMTKEVPLTDFWRRLEAID